MIELIEKRTNNQVNVGDWYLKDFARYLAIDYVKKRIMLSTIAGYIDSDEYPLMLNFFKWVNR